jgi:hypothetical protein
MKEHPAFAARHVARGHHGMTRAGREDSKQAALSWLNLVPASLEMMQLLRDEHRLIANRLELRIATEKKLAYGDARN